MGYFTLTKEKFPSENSKVWWRDFSKAEKVTYGGREGGSQLPLFCPSGDVTDLPYCLGELSTSPLVFAGTWNCAVDPRAIRGTGPMRFSAVIINQCPTHR